MAEAKKKRGQKPLPPAPNDGVVVDVASIETVMAEAEQMEVYQSDIINTFGGGLPWNLKHYEHAIRQELRTGCEAFVRAGAHLIVAKACAEHGEWSSLLERIGLSRSHAHRMMEAAKRIEGISNVATSQHFMKSVGSQSKLIELLSLPEEQFTELAETGETDGLTVDDVDRMAIRELRSSVRDLRADLQAKDERISKLSDDLNKQHEAVAKAKRKWEAMPADEQTKALFYDVVQQAQKIRALIAPASDSAGLAGAAVKLMTHGREHDTDTGAMIGGVIASLIGDLRLLRDGDLLCAPVFYDKPLAQWEAEADAAIVDAISEAQRERFGMDDSPEAGE